jgi:hypothetical protein
METFKKKGFFSIGEKTYSKSFKIYLPNGTKGDYIMIKRKISFLVRNNPRLNFTCTLFNGSSDLHIEVYYNKKYLKLLLKNFLKSLKIEFETD